MNAGGSSFGGTATYVLGFTRELARGGDRGLSWRFLVLEELAPALRAMGSAAFQVEVHPVSPAARRIAWEQTFLAAGRRRAGTHVLLNLGNFAPLAGPRPQVLLAQNALHFSELRFEGRRGVRLRVETAIARASVRRADVVLAPTTSMAKRIGAKTGRKALPVPFGPGLIERHVPSQDGRVTFLHRTTWGPHKRLSDLLLAVRDLAHARPDAFVVRTACDPRTPFARSFAESRRDLSLLDDPVIARHLEFRTFGAEGQRTLDGDAVVVPSVTESFCFPLAEAVGARVPVVAADADFARELCGDGAFFARPADPGDLARQMGRIIDGERPPPPAREVSERLSWERHADRLADVCHRQLRAHEERGTA